MRIILFLLAITLIVIVFAVLPSCTKEEVIAHNCAHAYLYSDKYTTDSVLIRSDKMWDDVICDDAVKSVKEQNPYWFLNCNTMQIEHWYYIFK